MSFVDNNPVRYTDPSGHIPKDEWIKRYGINYVREMERLFLKTKAGQKKLDFLYSSAFEFGNIVVIGEDGYGRPVHQFLIGATKDGKFALLDLSSGSNVTLEDFTNFFSGEEKTRWNASIRQEPKQKSMYFSGGWRAAASDQCPTCDPTLPASWHTEIIDNLYDYVDVEHEKDNFTLVVGIATMGAGVLGAPFGVLGSLVVHNWSFMPDWTSGVGRGSDCGVYRNRCGR